VSRNTAGGDCSRALYLVVASCYSAEKGAWTGGQLISRNFRVTKIRWGSRFVSSAVETDEFVTKNGDGSHPALVMLTEAKDLRYLHDRGF